MSTIATSQILEPPPQRQKGLYQTFITNLSFSKIREREQRITDAMKRTFEWIFCDPKSGDAPWSNFREWLETGRNLCWIKGKPGSGKSTLMKYIHEHPQTRMYLEKWSGSKPLVTARFFFWNSGTGIQMSHEGLLRTLLHDILQQMPEQIPMIFPDRCNALQLFDMNSNTHKHWGLLELLQSLKSLLVSVQDTTNMVLFVDGLDELEGDCESLAETILSLSKHPNVKLCVASRPWNVFEDAFETLPSLRIQDLTLPDIKIYVDTRFSAHSGFRRLQQYNSHAVSDLNDKIASKSNGVFLWVHLVVASLLRALSNGDKLSDLQRRLDALPRALEDLLWKILQTVNSDEEGSINYMEHASQLFQICRAYSKFGHSVDSGTIDLVRLYHADEEFSGLLMKNSSHRISSSDEDMFIHETMVRRLNSSTKGLLESNGTSTRSKVQHLHRTVKDFIEREDIWAKLLSQTKPPFDPDFALAAALGLDLKNALQGGSQTEQPFELLQKAFKHGCRVKLRPPADIVQLFDHIEEISRFVAGRYEKHHLQVLYGTRNLSGVLQGRHSLLLAAITWDLSVWVEALIARSNPQSQPIHPIHFETAMKYSSLRSRRVILDSPNTLEIHRIYGPGPPDSRFSRLVSQHIQSRGDDMRVINFWVDRIENGAFRDEDNFYMNTILDGLFSSSSLNRHIELKERVDDIGKRFGYLGPAVQRRLSDVSNTNVAPPDALEGPRML